MPTKKVHVMRLSLNNCCSNEETIYERNTMKTTYLSHSRMRHIDGYLRQ